MASAKVLIQDQANCLKTLSSPGTTDITRVAIWAPVLKTAVTSKRMPSVFERFPGWKRSGLPRSGFLAGSAKRLVHAVGTFRVNEDDRVASQNGLRHDEVQHHAFTGLGRSDNEQAALKVFEGSAQRLLGRVQPVKIRHADFFGQLSSSRDD